MRKEPVQTLASDGAAPAMPGAASGAVAAPQADRLDRYDIAILRELQQDARLSNAELAARIGLSPAPTWRRVKRL
jgi:Lrp/AsnC family leucine-responsive transcriptional regulator